MDRENASSTALLIATGALLLASRPSTASLISPEQLRLAEWVMAHYSRKSRWMRALLRRGWGQALCHALERATIPGIVEHYAVRKQVLERLATESEAGQLVVLGAGFDMLATRRLAARPGLKAFEVDHPNTQKWKERGLRECGFNAPQLFSADLGDAGQIHRLGRERLAQEKTLWVAEGLLMYFPEEEIREILAAIREATPPGSRLAFTYMEPGPDGRVSFTRPSGLVNGWLAHVREPFAWGIRREELPKFLEESGYRFVPVAPEVVEPVVRLNVGEHIALAEVLAPA